MSARKLVLSPAEEPFDVEKLRAWARFDSVEDDDNFEGHIKGARTYLEGATERAFITQTWALYLDGFPCGGEIALPFGQLRSVTTFQWTNVAGVTTYWTPSGSDLIQDGIVKAHVDTVSEPGLIRLAYGQSWPFETLKTVNPIRIEFACGWTADELPEDLREGIALLAASRIRNREAVIVADRFGATAVEVPYSVSAIISKYRLYTD